MLKKFFSSISVTLLAIVVFCSFVQAKPIKKETAERVAANLVHSKKKQKNKKITSPSVSTIKEQNHELYHIVNYPEGGWAVVAADDAVHPVIAYSDIGSFPTIGTPPPQLELWMGRVKSQIRKAKEEKVTPSQKVKDDWARLTVEVEDLTALPLSYGTLPGEGQPDDDPLAFATMGPLVTTQWDQGKYFNQYCPIASGGPDGHVWAGCIATAMAQVMKFHNHPDVGYGSNTYTNSTYGVQSADFGATTYDWASMPDPTVGSYNDAIATILYHSGVSVNMNYDTTGSGASIYSALNALKSNFKYSSGTTYLRRADYDNLAWSELLRTEINNSRPMIYEGENSTGSAAHAFVVDGYDTNVGDDYFHFNWGWGGSYDGYYYLDSLTPMGRNYSYDQGAIVGIEPVRNPSLNYPYAQGFENGIPEEWLESGEIVSASPDVARTGNIGASLVKPPLQSYNKNGLELHINVPEQGAELSFWVKRWHESAYAGTHSASIKAQFDDTALHTFYSGNFNDNDWLLFTLDLAPWSGSNIRLTIQQTNRSTTDHHWTYVDDVIITTTVPDPVPGDFDGNGNLTLMDVITGLRILSGSSDSGNAPGADVDGDGRTGMPEVLYSLRSVSGY